jgi:AraC-like DNA-binding protein
MAPFLPRSTESAALWHVSSFGHDQIGRHDPYWYENRNRQPETTVVFQLTRSGRLRYRDGSGDQLVEPGRAMLCSYGESSAYGLLPEDRAVTYHNQWLTLNGAGLAHHWNALRETYGSIIHVADHPQLQSALSELMLLATDATRRDPIVFASSVHHFVMQVWQCARQVRRRGQTSTEQAIDDLLEYPTQPWSLKQLAARHDCSREHLSRLFYQRTGQSPGRYLRQARLRRATQLLTDTRLPLREVARQSGYTSPHTLARQIRAATGKPPSALRQDLAAEDGPA